MPNKHVGMILTVAAANGNHRALAQVMGALDVKHQLNLVYKCLLNVEVCINVVIWKIGYWSIVSVLRPNLQGSK